MYRQIISSFIYFFLFFTFSSNSIYGQVNPNPQGSFEVEVGGTVSSKSATPSPNQISTPSVLVTITGFSSPNASIVIVDASGTSIATLTADAGGNFTATNLNMSVTAAEYCFRVVDFKRLGTSESCMTIDPTTQSTISNIYLPPTIGVERAEISEGEEAVIYGYTMPGATVRLRLSTGDIVSITADETGYYEYRNNALAAGDYSFVASASYNSTDSLDAKNSALLKKLSPEQVARKAREALEQISDEGGFPWWLLFIPLFGLIGGGLFWFLKKHPEILAKFTPFIIPYIHKLFPNKGLHHDKIIKQVEKENQV